jgi:hypothetical protein
MERIILEVDDNTAKAWRNTSVALREQIGKNLEIVLNDSLTKTKEVNFELLLKEIREEAAKNGLTEKILNELLNDEN